MRKTHASIVLAILAAPALAQADNNVAIPTVFTAAEGDLAESTLFNSPYLRWQQVESDTMSIPHLVSYLYFRRDGCTATPGATAKSIDIEIMLAMGVQSGVPLQGFTATFANNYWPGTETVVLPKTTISLPDWSQMPVSLPAPFPTAPLTPPGLRIPLAVFHNHPSFGFPLVVELQTWSSGGTHAVDMTAANGDITASTAALGSGCMTANGRFTLFSHFPVTQAHAQASWTLNVTGAPGAQAVTALLGVLDPNLPLGMCENLRSSPLLSLPIGASSAGGVAGTTLSLGAIQASWIGAALTTQAIALDLGQPGLPFALSNGQATVVPPKPAFDAKHTYATSPTATTGQGPFQGCVILMICDTVSCP